MKNISNFFVPVFEMFLFLVMLRRQVRERREFAFRKALDKKKQETEERLQKEKSKAYNGETEQDFDTGPSPSLPQEQPPVSRENEAIALY